MKKITFLCAMFIVALSVFSQNLVPLWEFSTTKGNLIEDTDTKSGFAYYNGELLVSSRRALTTQVVMYDAATGTVVNTGGNIKTLPHNSAADMRTGGDITIDENGAIYCGSVTSKNVIKWDNIDAESSVVFKALPDAPAGVFHGMDVWVDVNGNGCLVTTLQSSTTIYYIPIYNNVAGEEIILTASTAFGGVPRVHVVDPYTFWVDGTAIKPTLFVLNEDLTIKSQTAITPSDINGGVNGIVQFDYKEKTYLVCAANNHATASGIPTHSAALYELNKETLSVERIGEYLPENGMGSLTDYSQLVKPVVNVEAGVAYIYLLGGTNGMAGFSFTVETEEAVSPVFTYRVTEITKGVDAAPFTNPLITEIDGTITYTSSDPEVATVDANGKVTVKAAGITNIVATASATNAYQTATVSYRLVVSSNPVFEFANSTVEKVTTDEPFINTLTNNSDGDITYTSSDTSVATIDDEGKVTIVAKGTTVITASVAETEIYNAAEANYTLNVNLAEPNFSYGATEVDKYATDPAFTNELTNNSDGEVSYTSLDTSVATVNPQGEVTIVGVGTTTITASVTETATYKAANASYTLTVSQSVVIEPVDGTVLYMGVKGGEVNYIVLNSDDKEVVSTGISAGDHPLSMMVHKNNLYVVDAGVKFGYVEEPEIMGDGEVFVVSYDKDLKVYARESIINNIGGDSNLDFHYGYIEKDGDQLYALDRRDGIRKIPLDTRNAKFNASAYPYWVDYTSIGYNGNGMSFGFINGPLFKYNDIWHWGKNSTGSGIFRFEDSDIGVMGKAPEAGVVGNLYSVRGAVLDEGNGMLYLADSKEGGRILAFSLDEDRLIAIVDKSPTDSEGGTGEPLFVTGMVVDGEYLYWAYRGPNPGDDPEEFYRENPLAKSGIKRIKISDIMAGGYVDDKVEFFINDIEVYGLAIGNISGKEPAVPTFKFAEATVTKELGDEPFINELTSNTDGEITYSSSDPNVATVAADGRVTLLAEGEITITANATATDDYKAARASYKLKVEKPDGIAETNNRNIAISSTSNGIEVKLAGEAIVELYSINGALLEIKNVYEEYTFVVNKGVYIIKVNENVYKVVR